MASGIGAHINALNDANPIAVFYGEDQGRYVLTVTEANVDKVQVRAEAAGVFCPWIGRTGGTNVVLGDAKPVAVEELQKAHEGWFPALMA